MDSYKVVYDDEIELGMQETFSKRVTEEDVEDFAKVTGDFNPMHMDDEFAEQTQFHGRVAHGMISAGMISACLGTKMPGPGAVYLGQTLRFNKPVHFGDVLVVNVKVIKVDQKKSFKIVTLDTIVTNQDGEVVTSGEAKIMPVKR